MKHTPKHRPAWGNNSLRCGLLGLALLAAAAVRADVAIPEFMASNGSTLQDDFGNYEDWIELRNTGATNVNLLNWSLTDSKSNPVKWQFPAINLPAGGHLVVFASNRDRKTAGQPLHTNFKIGAGGGYLSLRRPDSSVATAFDPYPAQITDIAYGFSTSNNVVKLATTNSTGRFLVPASGALGLNWTTNGFNDAAWLAATNGIGFETGTSEFGFDYAGHVLAFNPAGYWRLNELPGTQGVQATNTGSLGAAYHGTPYGGVTFGQTSAIANGANTSAWLDNTGQIAVPADANTQLSGSFSVEFWVKQTNSSSASSYRSPVFARGPDVHGYNFYISGSASMNIEFWAGTGSGWNIAASAGNAIPVGQWMHVVGVYNSGTASLRLYLNGQLVDTAGASVYARATDGTPIQIGGPSSLPLQGGLDEVALYNTALSDANVLAHYQAGTNAAGNYVAAVQAQSPIGWWRLGEPVTPISSLTATNLGTLGAAANGTYSTPLSAGLTSLRPPIYSGLELANNSINFNNAGRMTVPFNAGLNTSSFTLDFWAKPTGSPSDYRGVLSSYDSGAERGIAVIADGGNIYSVFLGTGGSWKALAGPPAQLNVWSHLTITCDGSTAIIYENGVPYLTNAVPFQPNTTASFQIGRSVSPDGTSYNFPGELDEVAYYPTVLTPAQVAERHEIVLAGEAGTNRNYASLIQRDIQAQMLNVNASVYYRLPFTVTNVAEMSALKVRFKADDGYAAWLNGQWVASASAPGGLAWNSAATTRAKTVEAVTFDETDVSDFRSALVAGTNVLAIQGLNFAATNADFLNLAEVEATYAGAIGTNGVYLLPATPGTLNGVGTAAPGPAISSVGFSPAFPTDADSLTVTCRVAQILSPIGSVTLNWRVMYGALTQTSMFDDGAHGDGPAGDGVFGAVIPAANHSAGQMVRWYVTAVDTATRSSRWPLFLEPLNSAEFQGTMIAAPSVVSAIPVWYWFAENTAAADTRTGTRCSVYFNGEFFDNVFVRERGGYSSYGSQKFDFNTGDHPKMNDTVGRVGEVNLNSNGNDDSYMRVPVAFAVYRSAGQPGSDSFPILMRVNGSANRVGVYVEQPDEDMLERSGLKRGGALYKMVQRITLTPMLTDPTDGVEKKTRKDEGRGDLQAMCDALQQTNNVEARAAWMFDNLDLANFANMMACRMVVADGDDVRKNMYFYRDTLGKREWSVLPWDKDWAFGSYFADTHPFRGDYLHEGGGANNEQWSYHYEAMFNDPRTREMVLRRMRSLADQLSPAWLTARTDFYYTNSRSAVTTGGLSRDTQVNTLKTYFTTRLSQINGGYTSGDPFIPTSQSSNVVVGIGAVEFNPASGNQDEEFIELVNTNPVAVDVSGWKIGGAVSMTLAPGTVIGSNSSMYVSPDVVAFRARTVSPKGGEKRFVQGNYNGRLNAWGESLTLTDRLGFLVASNAYVGAPSDVQRYLRVTEIMYNPSPAPAINADAQQFEYIELKNISASVSLNLNGVRFTNGVTFNFSGSVVTNLAPGQRVLVVRNVAAFTARYGGGLPVAGAFAGALDNGGEALRLEDAVGEKVLEFAYNNAWYPITDGLGFSLVIVDENAPWSSWDAKSSWRSSGTLNGAPGSADPVSTIGTVLVNEVLAHTDLPDRDSIELYNPTDANIDLGGWFLTDDFYTPKKYWISAGTVINAGGYLVFNDTQFNTGAGAFLLSEYGEQAYLFSGDASTNLSGYVHGVDFAESPNGVSFGRYVNSRTNTMFVLQASNTLGGANAGPRVGPVVISEIMCHPPDLPGGVDNDADEYLELQNITGTNVALFCTFTNEAGYGLAALTNTWRLRDGVDFDFPTNVILAGGARLLVVGFNPTNAALSNAFVAKYSVPAGVKMFGPWSGKLDNSKENIELKYPDRPDVTVSNVIVPFVMVEKVTYNDDGAWPTNADGGGASLQRLNVNAFGNDVINWFAADSTTGQGNSIKPVVSLTAPADGSVLGRTPAIALSANATDPDGSVTLVEFLDGASVIGSDTAAPYSILWTNAPYGAHTLTARATDNSGAIGLSAAISITVTSLPPTASITVPVSGASIPAGAVTNVSATASDPDTTVVAVDFYENGSLIGTDSTAPYSISWTPAIQGARTLTAVARDETGPGAASAGVGVTITQPISLFADAYANRGLILGYTNTVTGSNATYTAETGEPASFVSGNGRSAWISWTAPASGTCTMDTIGSDFDTVLSIYTGSVLTSLSLLTGDDDSGGSSTSRASFAATAGVTYQVKVTAYGGTGGSIVFHQGLAAPPVITSQPQSQTVAVGSNVTFNVTANGLPPLSYQWRFNGGNISGATASALSVSNAQATNSGNYTVVVTASGGSVTSVVAVLTVQSAPSITGQPQSQTVTVGSNVTFSVTAVGSIPLYYQWRRDGALLAGETASSLLLANVQASQAGDYTVVVTNVLGAATSSVATLTVVLPPATLTLIETNGVWRYLDDGTDQGTAWQATAFNDSGWSNGTAKFGYNTSGNSGIATVLNYGGDPNNKRVTYYFRKQFVLNSLSGITNLVAEIQRDDGVAVYLNGVERYREGLTNNAVYASLSTNLAGGDTSLVPVTALLGTDGLVVGTNTIASEVHQSSVSSSDLGFALRLTSYGQPLAPAITTPPAGQSVAVGSNVTFTVTASGSPMLAYQWRTNGVPLPGATLAALSLNNVQLNNAGAYTVVVTNTYGSVTSAVAMLMVAVPQPPVISSARIVAGPAIEITGTGTAGQNYVLVTATNINAPAWLAVSTNTANGSGTVIFTQPFASGTPLEYFRLRTP